MTTSNQSTGGGHTPDADGYVTLSDGKKVFASGIIDELDRQSIALAERFIAAGHELACDEDGVVDFFYLEGGYCNGPGCIVCRDSVCQHCRPDYEPDQCPGAEAVAAEEREQRRQQFLKPKAEFEPGDGEA